MTQGQTTINVALTHVILFGATVIFSLIGATWYLSGEIADMRADIRWLKNNKIRETRETPTRHDLQSGFVTLATLEQKQINGIMSISDNFSNLVAYIRTHDNLRAGR